MNIIKQGLKVNLKHLLKNKILFGFITLILLFNIYAIFFIFNEVNNLLSIDALISRTAYIVSAFMLVNIFIGYELSKMDRESNVEELISTISKGKEFNALSKILLGLLINISIYSLLTIIIIFLLITRDKSTSLYLPIIFQVILYQVIPCFISYLIGLVVESYFKGHKGYLICIICWLLSSAVNTYAMKILEGIMQNDIVYYIKYFLSLLYSDISISPYNSISSFPLDSYNISKSLIILFIVLSLYNIAKFNFKYKKLLFSTLIIILISIGNLILYKDYIKNEVKGTKGSQNFYVSHREYLDFNKVDFQINAVNLKVSPGRNCEFIAELSISELKSKNELQLLLHTNFSVLKIYDENKNELPFNRSGEVITISTGTESLDDLKITIQYTGIGNHGLYMNKNEIYLPNYVSFIPTNKTTIDYKNKIKYSIDLESDYELYSNLDKVNGSLEGYTNENIFIISSKDLVKTTINNIEIVYSSILYDEEKLLSRVEKVFAENEEWERKTKEIINSNSNDIKEIYFIDIPLVDSNIFNSNGKLLLESIETSSRNRTMMYNSYDYSQLNLYVGYDIDVLFDYYFRRLKGEKYEYVNSSSLVNQVGEIKDVMTIIDNLTIKELEEFIKEYLLILNEENKIPKVKDLYEKYYELGVV